MHYSKLESEQPAQTDHLALSPQHTLSGKTDPAILRAKPSASTRSSEDKIDKAANSK